MTPAPLINLSFYHFTRLSDLPELRARLRKVCTELDLRGTVLLAPEGVNVMISGTRESIDRFRDFSKLELRVPLSSFKEGTVTDHSFRRMLIKIKKEIITVGDSEVRPDERTATRLSAQELKKWLDEGKPMHLVDTRNDYEILTGTFQGAEDLGLKTSREFADKAAKKLDAWKDRPVVTFCTGGIRCEKASAVLLKLGLNDVYQLDGGILRYFEENGSAHFKGDCFVFDWRLAVDGKLSPTSRSDDTEQDFGRHRVPPQR
jgi:UPF0176 protein